MSSGIFISYRREDSAGQAGRLYDRLSARFGRDRVFMDVDSIGAGRDFTQEIERAIGSSEAFIVIIGRDWLTVSDGGQPRLNNPRDYVRIEVETALTQPVTVIPVLVRNSSMPRQDELPEPLALLSTRNAVEVRDKEFDYDVDRVIGRLEDLLGERTPPGWRGIWVRLLRLLRKPLAISATVAALIIVGLILYLVTRGPPPITEDLAFLSDRTGNAEIFASNIGSSPWKQLTTGLSPATPEEGTPGIVNASEYRPDWSLDGKRIAFVSDRDSGRRDLYVMSASGAGVTRLTNNDALEGAPDWSPDGERIAYFVHSGRSTSKERSALWVIDAGGTGEPDPLTDDKALVGAPDWSPDGRQILFVSNADGDPDIFVMNVNERTPRRIFPTSTKEFQPTWSPDGQRIAFEGAEDDNRDIFVMDSDGDNHINLTGDAAVDQLPAWSPDGRWIAYGSEVEGNYEIFVVRADGSGEPRNLTNDPAQDTAPAWRPEDNE
jgi:Tol biopolymer transport system component